MRTRRRLQKPRWRRQAALSAMSAIKVLEESKKTDLVICIETSVLDAIRLHSKVSRTDALSRVLDVLLKIKHLNFGDYQIKVPATPVVYSVSITPLSGGRKRAEVTLNTKVVVFSIDTLSSLIADEALLKALDSQS